MKKTIVLASGACAVALLLAACAPGASPAPTVTVAVTETVTATPTSSPAPDPSADPVADEAYAAPTMSSSDAIELCVAAHERSGFDSTLTGGEYTFLTQSGAWWVVLEGENENGALYGDCTVGEDSTDVGYGEAIVDSFTPALVDTVVNEKGGM